MPSSTHSAPSIERKGQKTERRHLLRGDGAAFSISCNESLAAHSQYAAQRRGTWQRTGLQQRRSYCFRLHTHTYIHTHVTALCLGIHGWAGTRKVKPIWILLEQETVSGSGISCCHMQVCISFQRDNHASNPPLSFLQAGCPSCHPTNSVKALKGSER